MLRVLRRNWFNILSLLLAAIGIVIALQATRIKSPRYAISGMNLASTVSSSEYGDLRVLWNGEVLPRITVTNICIWNAGRDTIDGADIAEPFTIRVKNGANIRSVKILAASRPEIKAGPNQAKWTMPIVMFKFLDHNDWILVQVLHTGSKPDDCYVDGTVKGCGDGIPQVFVPDENSLFCPGKLLSMVLVAESLVGLLFYKYIQRKAAQYGARIRVGRLLGIGFIAFLLVGMALISIAAIPYYRAVLPFSVLPR